MRQGFSLVELSIVLAVIGLLTGGIVAAQSLIRSSELRSVISDVTRFRSAIQAFELKYSALPGDMPNAVNYWGIAAGATGNDATCTSASVITKATCNGNGNNLIGVGPVAGVYSEMFHGWKHLSNEGLLQGTYTGKTGAGSTTDAELGVNVPVGKIENTGYTLNAVSDGSGSASLFPTKAGNLIIFGTPYSTSHTYGPALTGNEAWSIDSKLDEGAPGLGDVRTYRVASFNCVSSVLNPTTPDPADAVYIKNSKAISCPLIFYIDSGSN